METFPFLFYRGGKLETSKKREATLRWTEKRKNSNLTREKEGIAAIPKGKESALRNRGIPEGERSHRCSRPGKRILPNPSGMESDQKKRKKKLVWSPTGPRDCLLSPERNALNRSSHGEGKEPSGGSGGGREG